MIGLLHTFIVFLMQNVTVNNKIVYTAETIQRMRPFSIVYGRIVDGEDIVGKRLGVYRNNGQQGCVHTASAPFRFVFNVFMYCAQ